jgi:hypothetical protein
MTVTMHTAATNDPGGPTPAPCVRFPGHRQGDYVHPEGRCACFWGGPAPIRALTDLDIRLQRAAQAAAASVQHLPLRRRPLTGRRRTRLTRGTLTLSRLSNGETS